jgi:DNA processing protein
VVVVEAAERSGALITASAAGEFGREVFAVPGRLTSETSRGPHGLLRDGATLVRSWSDIVQELPSPWRDAVRDASRTIDVTPLPTATTAESTVLAVLAADEPQHIEDVIVRCGMLPARVSATLMSLELTGHVRQLEGQRWIAVGKRSRRR